MSMLREYVYQAMAAPSVLLPTAGNSVGASIFVRDAHGFQQRGLTFTDYGNDWSGIALSYDGKIVAIGQRRWHSSQGRVGVSQWRDDNGDGSMKWVQMGTDIIGLEHLDQLGYYGWKQL